MFRSFGHNRSSILDGGLPAWEAHGCPVISGESLAPKSPQFPYPPPFLDEASIRSKHSIPFYPHTRLTHAHPYFRLPTDGSQLDVRSDLRTVGRGGS